MRVLDWGKRVEKTFGAQEPAVMTRRVQGTWEVLVWKRSRGMSKTLGAQTVGFCAVGGLDAHAGQVALGVFGDGEGARGLVELDATG
jgi:hypothetical protein